ncbi:MAG: NAD(+)/NADH kinase [Myxococcota bacterium]|nr:NAD(+)/NADH kinase [Myxococcota bacterium]
MKTRVIVVEKRTAYGRFVEEERDPRAQLLVKRKDPSVRSWVEGHREHQKTVETVERVLTRLGVHVHLVRRAHAQFDASDAALVVAVGGDGTLLAASNNLDAVPILGVNSAPRHSVGFFCAAKRSTFAALVTQALEGKLAGVTLTRMQVSVAGRVRASRILNDALFAHVSPAATSRYVVQLSSHSEEQRSSGFWIGPAAGSTAAQRSAGGRVQPLSSKKLQLVVREPYVPAGTPYRLTRRLIAPGEKVIARSNMDEAALWLDGPHRQVPVRLGDVLEFTTSAEPLRVLGIKSRRA